MAPVQALSQRIDLVFRQTVARGFVAPLRYGLANLLCYFAGLAVLQIEIPRHLHRQSERGSVVILIDRRAKNARLDVDRMASAFEHDDLEQARSK
jgi:hypothetical protein